jgi:hypothetical protein
MEFRRLSKRVRDVEIVSVSVFEVAPKCYSNLVINVDLKQSEERDAAS